MPFSRPSLISKPFCITGFNLFPKVRSRDPTIDAFTLTLLSGIRSALLPSFVANSISLRVLNSSSPSCKYIFVLDELII